MLALAIDDLAPWAAMIEPPTDAELAQYDPPIP